MPPKPEASQTTLSVFYFSDAHGKHLSLSDPEACRLASLAKFRESEAGDSLLLNGGDDFGGGEPWDLFMEKEGPVPNPLYEYLNAYGVDAICPGNHDLDWGIESLVEKAPRDFPLFIASNLTTSSPLNRVTHDIVLFDFLDKRVAVLGLANTNHIPDPYSDFVDPAKALGNRIADAQSLANIVVVLSHNGTTYDKALLDQLPPGVLLCGAHTHQLIPSIEKSPQTTNYIQAGLGLSVYNKAVWSVSNRWTCSTIPISKFQTSTISQAETNMVAAANQLILAAGEIDVQVEKLQEEDPWTDRYRGQSSTLNWVCDQISASLPPARDNARLIAIGCAFMGNRRLNGSLSKAEWYQLFPYGDQLYKATIPWCLLPRILELNTRRVLEPPGYRDDIGILHFDGKLSYEVELSQDSPKLMRAAYKDMDFHPNQFDTLELYTHSYVASGAGGYSNLFQSAGLDFPSFKVAGPSIRETLWKQAKEHGVQIPPSSQKRFTFLSTD